MDGHYDPSDHSFCKRRRLQAKSPLAAHLVLDENLRGGGGKLSEDLWVDLFGSTNTHGGRDERDAPKAAISGNIKYIAATPWSPLSSILDSVAWTILPVQLQSPTQEERHSTLYFSPNSTAVQSFLKAIENSDSSRHAISTQKPIEIQLQPVKPLLLDSVFVTVEKGLLQTIDKIQNQFGGGYNNTGFGLRGSNVQKKAGNGGAVGEDEAQLQKRLVSVVREALLEHDLIHTGDPLPLPLPPHPITHVPSPPAIITACEPVNQGFVCSKTKITLVQARSSQARLAQQLQPVRPIVNDVLEDTEDTSNEQFYSAAEDRGNESTNEVDESSQDESEEGAGRSHTDSEESDDSLEDMISLSAPGLPQPQSGTLSAITSATPRPGIRRGTGVHTPSSVFSNLTSMTSRPGQIGGKSFKVERLSRRIPNEALHPRPHEVDDDDAFVFVDTTALARIRCFSGDWVRLETSSEPTFNELSSLHFGGVNGFSRVTTSSRPVRIFGLPGLSMTRPRYALDRSEDRKPSLSHGPQVALTPSAFIPPVLHENLGNPKFVKLSPWQAPVSQTSARKNTGQTQPGRSTYPPSAGEVVIMKLRTPSALDRTLDTLTYSGLRDYFKRSRRILKRGDLIGISVDTEVGKATYTASTKSEDKNEDDIARAISQAKDSDQGDFAVIWFYVRELSTFYSKEGADNEDEDRSWEGALTCDIGTTTLRTTSAETGDRLTKIAPLAEQGMGRWFSNETGRMASTPHVSSLASGNSTRVNSAVEKRLSDLFTAAVSSRAATLRLPPLFILLHSTQRQIGKSYTAKVACMMADIRPFFIDCFDLVSEGLAGGSGEYRIDETLKQRAERVLDCGSESNAIILQHIEMLTADRILPTLKEVLSKSRILIATTTELDNIPEAVRGHFSHEFELAAPDETERESIINNAIIDQKLQLAPSVDLNSVALKTAALVAGDLVNVVARASLARSLRLEQLAASQTSRLAPSLHHSPSSSPPPPQITVPDILISGGPTAHFVLPCDFTSAVTAARSAFTSSIGAPKIPSVTWSDVGGLASAKSSIMETISLPLERPELFATGMRKRSGILFYGPPGTGKTLLAKAIATEFSLNFFSVKGPELLNMYIGESEANVRRVFQRARDARPCVVFFDELDSVAPKRGNQGDSGGVMDRIVSQLLAELDGMSSSSSSSNSSTPADPGAASGVFVIGATNRPDLLDPALLRPGRFDKMVYLGVADTHAQQLTILQALTRKFRLSTSTDLARVAEQLPFTYTGADLYALCSDAMLKAVMRKAREVDNKVETLNAGRKKDGREGMSTAWFFDHVAGKEDMEVVVEEGDFLEAKEELVASVSAQELAHFERIRRQFEVQDAKAYAPGSNSQALHPPQQRRHDSSTSPLSALPHDNGNRSHPATRIPLRPKPPPPKRSDTAIPAPVFVDSKGKSKGKAVVGVVANPDSGPDLDEEDEAEDGFEDEDDSSDDDDDDDGEMPNGNGNDFDRWAGAGAGSQLRKEPLRRELKTTATAKWNGKARGTAQGKGKGKARADLNSSSE